jgi:hypothetical protein
MSTMCLSVLHTQGLPVRLCAAVPGTTPSTARARFRNYLNPAYRYFGVGLRVVRSSPSLS